MILGKSINIERTCQFAKVFAFAAARHVTQPGNSWTYAVKVQIGAVATANASTNHLSGATTSLLANCYLTMRSPRDSRDSGGEGPRRFPSGTWSYENEYSQTRRGECIRVLAALKKDSSEQLPFTLDPQLHVARAMVKLRVRQPLVCFGLCVTKEQ